MGISPAALTDGVSRSQLDHAVAHAAATIAVGNGPTMILVIGPDDSGQLIEAAGVIRNEDVLYVHAAQMRAAYQPLLDAAVAQPGAATAIPDGNDPNGSSVDGLALSEATVNELREQAERGHDPDVLRLRLRTGRPAPLAIGDVLRLELDPATYAVCAARADADGVALPEFIRRTLRATLHTTATE